MKNKIKSPIEDSLRGIGKLGWTESGKMNSTLKRLESSFETDKTHSLKSNKTEGKCPRCSFTFMSNNPSRVPDHKVKTYKSFFSYENNICMGSWSRLPTGEKKIVDVESFTIPYTIRNVQTFSVGDKVIVDFTNLKHFYDENIMFETEIVRITSTLTILNDGSEISLEGLKVFFKDVQNSIPVSELGKRIALI